VRYEDLYKKDTSLRGDNTTAKRYPASDGYYGNSEQGHNHYSYVAKTGDAYEDMEYSNGAFSKSGASLSLDVMTSTVDTKAVRKFVSPMAGTALVHGQLKTLSATEEDVLEVYQNDTLVDQVAFGYAPGIYWEKELTLATGDVLYFVLTTPGSVSFNPVVDFTGSGEVSLHQNVDGEYGDVHPFYDTKNERMIMYYLSTGKEQNSVHEQFTTLATVSSDMINFSQLELYRDESNPPAITNYYALGVYECPDGIYRSCFGNGSYVGCSSSKDLINWQNGEEVYMDEETSMLAYHYRVNFGSDVASGRDPYIFYDKERQEYFCIVMNYYSTAIANGKKGLAIYTGNLSGDYSSEYYKALDCTGRGDPECPQVFKIGNRYYIAYSIYGTGTSGNVGKYAYRVGDEGKSPTEVAWDEKEERYLDGGDLHAAQLVFVGDKMYLYGWMTSVAKQNIWGGAMNLSREVIVNEDGTLGTRIDPCFSELMDKGLIEEVGTDARTVKRSILKANITASAGAKGGFAVNVSGNTYYIGIFNDGDQPVLAVTESIDQPDSGVFINLDGINGETDLTVLLDGGFIEAFVGGRFGLCARVNEATSYQVLSFTDGATVSGAEIHKLSDLRDILD
jgi:hypothetical protein